MNKIISKLCLIGLLSIITSLSFSQTAITVNVANVLNDVSNKPVGINMDYLMDGSYISPSPAISTTNSIKNMGMKFLRYPGGEKADNYLWSVSPWLKANPKFARVGSCNWPSNDPRFAESDYLTAKAAVLDFDEFMTMSQAVGGEPLIVVAYDAIYKPSGCGGTIPTKEQLLTNAAEWVRYANIVKGYNIKYWMVGNESWNNAANGSATAAQYRDDVIEFSKRMKAVDPTIKIIANGDVTSWWATVLPTASPFIDFLGVSEYPVWNYSGGYSYYQNNTPNLMGTVQSAINSINTYAQAADRSRIKVISTEINSIDWAGAWPDLNDLGHALNCFEIFGEHLKNPKVEAALMWNTRWVNNTTKPNDLYDAISKTGSLQSNGLALSIWGNYLLDKMVSSTSTTGIRTFASFRAVTNELNVYIINKETGTQSINLNLANYVSGTVADRWELKGTGPADVAPTLTKKGTEAPNNNSLVLSLPSVSITLLTFKVSGTAPITATITPVGNTTFCQGGSVVLNANTGTGYSYQWKKDGIVISGAINSSYTATAAGSYTVVVTQNSSTATSSPVSVAVNSLPPATITASGSTTIASGSSVTLNANTGTGLSYQWMKGGINISGATNASYIANSSGSYTVKVTNASGCSSISSATTVTVTTTSLTATVTPAGNTTFCQGGSVVLNANTGMGYSYQWKKDGSSISGASNASYIATSTGSYTVIITQNAQIATSSPVSVVVNSLPPATISASGSTTIASGSSVTLNANTGTGLSYQWMKGGINISGATSASYIANSAGTYTIKVTNAAGCSLISSATTVTVTSTSLTAAITTASSTTFCQGGSVVLNANTGTGYTYQWKKDGVVISGATNASYTATSTGSYTVVVTQNNSTATSSPVSVVVNSLPPATISASGSTTIASGSSVTLNANTGTGLSYQWMKGGINISGATNASYIANSAGTYTVKVTNGSGCSSVSSGKTVKIRSKITALGPISFTEGGSVILSAGSDPEFIYQWEKDGISLSEATSQMYTATSSGNYQVRIAQDSLSEWSMPLTVSVTSTTGISLADVNKATELGMSIYPSISSNSFNIITTSLIQTSVLIRVFDISGRLQIEQSIKPNQQMSFGENLSAGTYFIKISQENVFVSRKIIKIQ